MNTSSGNFENLPDINFAEKDTAVIEAEVIARFEKEAGRTLFPVDPLRQLLITFVYYLSKQRSEIDFAGKQNTLKYAGEGYLQNLAALLGIEILEPNPALTTLKFTLSTTRPGNTTIPAGTRATPGNEIYFATKTVAEIPAGELSVDVPAECTVAGIIGNGFLPGQINQLVDPFPFNYSVTNTELSQGGSDRESLDAFRERVRLAPESFSVAGPRLAYVYWAKTASPLIVDVSVVSPESGVVEIIPLLADGEIPSQPILDEVYKVCNADNVRPLTDFVVVRAPEVVNYDIDFTYYISRQDASTGLAIQQNVTEAAAAFVLWQKSALGRDINPSQLTKMLMKAGIKRVVVQEPEFKILQCFELGVAVNINPVYGGLEDD